MATLMRIHLDMRALLGGVARTFGLTAQQIEMLCLLKQHDAPTFGRLAEYLGCDRANITGMADRLTRRGFVVREADPADRRVTRLRLTEAGDAFADEVRAAVDAAIHARWSSPAEALG